MFFLWFFCWLLLFSGTLALSIDFSRRVETVLRGSPQRGE